MSRMFFLILMLLSFNFAQAEDAGRAAMWNKDGAVFFWQTNHFSCVVEFMFDGAALRDEITDLTVTVRVLGADRENLGVGKFKILEPLGGAQVARYQRGIFEGISNWQYPGREEGASSPLCWDGVTLQVESAVGKQSGNLVDLVRANQLVLKEFKRVNIKIGK